VSKRQKLGNYDEKNKRNGDTGTQREGLRDVKRGRDGVDPWESSGSKELHFVIVKVWNSQRLDQKSLASECASFFSFLLMEEEEEEEENGRRRGAARRWRKKKRS
jgi:hypothetical protein